MKINKKNSIQSLFIIVIITLIAVPIYLSYAMPVDSLEDSQEDVSKDIIEEQSTEGQTADEQEFNASISEETESDNNFETNVNSDNETIDPISEEDLSSDTDLKNTENESSENIVQNVSNNNQTGSEEKTDSEPKVAQDTSAEENANNSQNTTEQNTNYSLKATIYDSNQYETTTGTDLTEPGIQIDNWEHSTSKYLLINPTVPDDGNIYTVTVKLPKEMYVVGTDIAKPAGYSDVKFTKNSGIKINDEFTYQLEPLSGTIEYTMNYKAISGTIQLELRYDYALWDKQTNSPITKDGVNPIEVTLSRKTQNDIIENLDSLFVNKITSGSKISYRIHHQMSCNTAFVDISSITVKKEDKVKLRFYLLHPQQEPNDYKYFNSLVYTIQLPRYIDENNKVYYLNFDLDSINTDESSFKYESLIKNDTRIDEGIILLEYKNVYCNLARQIISFNSISDELINLGKDEYKFTGGKISCNIKGNSGKENIISQNTTNAWSIPNITYEIREKENVTCGGRTTAVTITDVPDNVISFLGKFSLRNSGTADSGEKEVYEEFDIENTNTLRVTAINLLSPAQPDGIDIEYKLIDDSGNLIYFDNDGNVVDSNTVEAKDSWTYNLKNSFKLNRELLRNDHKIYYFKSIKYKVKTIKAGTAYIGSYSFSCGPFYGTINKEVNEEKAITSKITITSISDLNIKPITANTYTSLKKVNTSTYFINNVKIDKTNIEAGESFIISGRIGTSDYPYGNSGWVKGIRLGIILPKDISINKITATKNENIKINDFEVRVSNEDLENNNRLWIIKFPPNICIGYYNKNLATLDDGNYIDFDIQLDTSYISKDYTFFARDSIYVAGDKQINGGGGAFEWTKNTDTYDLNENGSTTDAIGRISSSDTTNCQIKSNSAQLDIKDSIILSSSGNISTATSDANLKTQDDTVIYNLDILCKSGGNASEFLGYIPIPKKSNVVDNYLIDKNDYDLKLKNFPEITGSDIYELKYTFEQGLTYDTAKNVETWLSKEEIENNPSLNLEDVSMIKITSKNEIIENGSETRISINMKYGGDKYIEESGMENIWHSGFYYQYRNGSIENRGNHKTEGVNAKLTSSLNFPEITLTAAKDMDPQIEENINEYIQLNENNKLFKKDQVFSIKGVETYNVDLKTKTYVIENINMPGIEANKTFAITVKMNNGQETNILETSNTTPINLGKLTKEELLSLTYKIYNANYLSDNSTVRYIIVTLESDNGVIIKQKININRELAGAADPKSAIIAGKNYLTFDNLDSSVSISNDSAFTAQFVINYIPSNYQKQQIEFSNNLPIGTTLILEKISSIDDSTKSEFNYLYYKVTSEQKIIDLNDFVKMGTKAEKNNFILQGTEEIAESYLLIVDFSQCLDNLQSGDYSLKMVFEGSSVLPFNSKELIFKTTAKRSFEIKTTEEQFSGQDEFAIDYIVGSQAFSESKYIGRKLSLVIQAPENLPKDAYIVVGENNYNLNANKQFIIPLRDISNGSGQINLKLISNMLPKDETNYNLNLELWASATSNAIAPMSGEKLADKVITYKCISSPYPSLKVDNMERRILNKDRLTENNSITVNLTNTSNCLAYVELQKKIGTGYQKVTDKLSQVNGKTEHDKGSFLITPVEGTNTINFKLNLTTEPGTYRIVIKLTDLNNNKLLEVPYNFLILDE